MNDGTEKKNRWAVVVLFLLAPGLLFFTWNLAIDVSEGIFLEDAVEDALGRRAVPAAA